MKVSKTENRFKSGFQQPKTGLPKKPVLTSRVSGMLEKTFVYRETGKRLGRKEEAYRSSCH